MSLFEYLQLQPIDPREDGSVSEFDQYAEDETFDLSRDEDSATLIEKLEAMAEDFH